MTAKEVAYALNYKIDTVRMYRRRKSHFPFVKMGGRYYYRTEDILAYVRSLPLKKQIDLLAYHDRETHPSRRQPPIWADFNHLQG